MSSHKDLDPTLLSHPLPILKAHRRKQPGNKPSKSRKLDHGEDSYHGCHKLLQKVAIITGGDRGIGRAVAIAYAREGVDIVISYLEDHDQAQETAHWVKKAGRKVLLVPGDISNENQCLKLVEETIRQLGHLNILVNTASYEKFHQDIAEITALEWDKTFRINVYSIFFLIKAVIPHMPKGGSIINVSATNANPPFTNFLPYAASKGAIDNFTVGLAQALAKRKIRVNSVAPGSIGCPLAPTFSFKKQGAQPSSALKPHSAGQPVDLSPIFVLLASDEANTISGATIPITRGAGFPIATAIQQ